MRSMTAPATMSAARIHRMGSPEAIEINSVDTPIPAPGEILVAVYAAAVNFPDTLMIAGQYQVKAALPFVPGHEAAGVITAVGDGVTSHSPGDRVAVLAPGAFAEYLVAPAGAAVPIPAEITFAEAAATWVCHLTAYHALRSTAEIRSGDNVLVLGAGGGVGLAAVELAASLGARVVAAASSSEKLDAARRKGAHATINYTEGNLRDGIRAALGPGAIDAVIDPVGGPHAESALRELRWGGRFVTLGYASGEIPRIPLNLILLKGAVVKGLEIRTFAHHDPQNASRDRDEFTALWRSGRIRPLIHARFPLSQAREALELVTNRSSIGKTIIEVVSDYTISSEEH
ncbi:UNVERIFIED_ORG: NADPH:quinone reductase-like Zn-dependent oxidoreductase [Nocardia globerula]|uniref:NADPH:quinone reductase-like Zn-dependent oxidoreductase n=2 Tax=Nocardiaceae TaxID=85025 RepID=A0A652YSM7_NOCGL|nr:NADPH:quinone oxidoreductase family protein [Rhodococcus globerulus]PVX67089.1 NADPH:quinone reductase-like Zn-dependent oxidoreductase [Rhodococcus globerulus]